MKARQSRVKVKLKKFSRASRSTRRSTPLRKLRKQQPTLLERISAVTEELQKLRSRLANAGDDVPAVGTHRISSLEAELERLWELRRHEQSAPLRQSALSEEEEKELAFPSGMSSRGF